MKLNRDRWRGGSMQRGRCNKRLDSGLKLYEFRRGRGRESRNTRSRRIGFVVEGWLLCGMFVLEWLNEFKEINLATA